MLNLNIAHTGLQASQLAMDTVANNIANADTEGYHRQVTALQERTPQLVQNMLLGSGVELDRIERAYSQIIENSLTANLSERSAAAATLEIVRQVESLLTPGSGSLPERVQVFFNELERLSANPDDRVQREIVLRSAVNMTSQLRTTMEGLAQLRGNVAAEIRSLVDGVNAKSGQIAELNQQVYSALARGLQPNDQLDLRGQMVNELAEVMDAELAEQGEAHSVVLLGGGTMMIGQRGINLQVTQDQAGNLTITEQGADEPLRIEGGRLAGLLAAHNTVIRDYEDRLQAFATALMTAFDRAHATGLGLNGPFDSLRSQRSIGDVTAPLDQAGALLPIEAGQLSISITDQATGERRTESLMIDPATQSLQDIATALSGIAHLEAIADSQSGTLAIVADAGYAFDFAGRLDTAADASAVTGTSRVSLSGSYTGTANDRLTFRAVGSGTIGVTEGLTVEVRNAAGSVLGTFDVGAGYEAGTSVHVVDGVRVTFTAGTLNAGDVFSTPVVADGDTSGLLAALGLNSFFVGAGASNIEVNSWLQEDSRRLATSHTGEPGDTRNLTRLVGVRYEQLTPLGSLTPEGFLASVTTAIGDQVRSAELVDEHVELLGQQLEAERDRYSGVDPNEEMIRMLHLQRAFQAAAKVITVAKQMMDELSQVIG
jgi:flagellar hook-associated protein FlgK